MPDKAWKAFERRIAKSLGVDRTPLSGSLSRLTSSDTLHPDLYVECRYRSRLSVHTWWLVVRQFALKEHKVPVLALHQAESRTTMAVIDWRFFLKLWNDYIHERD